MEFDGSSGNYWTKMHIFRRVMVVILHFIMIYNEILCMHVVIASEWN